jgi:hypothetical protein
MSALHPAMATTAGADVNVELAVNRPTRNLDLILLVGVRFLDRPAAVGTGIRQWRFVGFVDLLGRLAVSLGAVVLAGFAAGLFGRRLGRSFGERRSLAFTGTPLLVEEAGELFDLGAEIGVLPLNTETSFAR